ncbi:MAG: heme lyase CcmF/NrfE family subunit [Rhodothermales bacterium]
MLGILGQLLLLIAFVATGLSAFAFFRTTQYPADPVDWNRIGRLSWGAMAGALVTAWTILIYLIATHQFQYAYVWEHSSHDLPMYYLFSASWEGQEGSFLLWIMLNGLIGLALFKWAARSYVAPVMAIIAVCQVFLLSMIVGLQIGPLSIGASPFLTLAEHFPDAPIFQADPNFVPEDGNGLNDLLQNYWMVIHPPVLFIGFSTLIIPFAFAVAALWKKRYTEWVRPALPWTLLSVMFLGLGIVMGGYWAYETLSFGGYWAWDPVENSSLVPWLVGVAAIHMMLIQRKSGHGHKGALLMSILAYLLVIYSTFLTRSGILGDISVHSFVDLGLHTQLVLWILVMGGIGFGLLAVRYKELPKPRKEPHYLSREFMIFSGAVLVCAVAAVVILGTSSPILGRIFRDNPASVPIEFYNRWTLPLSIGVMFLAGLGQLFWWSKMSVATINRALVGPIALSVVSTLLILIFTPFVEGTVNVEAQQTVVQAGFWSVYGSGMQLLLLLFVSFFALYGNGLVLWRIARGNPKMIGGALSHVGLALFILGIIASSGFSNPLSNAAPGTERENFVAELGRPALVEGYTVNYLRQELTDQGRTRYVLDFESPTGRTFTVKPVVYKNNQGQWIQNPDLKMYVEKDIFVAVTPKTMIMENQEKGGEITLALGDSTILGDQEFALRFLAFDQNVDRSLLSKETSLLLKRGDTAILGDREFSLTFEDFNTELDPALLPDETEVAVAAVLNIKNQATGRTREIRPIYLIKNDRVVTSIADSIEDWNLTVSFTGMNVDTGEITLELDGTEATPANQDAVTAVLNVTNLTTGQSRELRPIYAKRADGSEELIQARVPDWNLTVIFSGMNVNAGEVTLTIQGVDVTTQDWVVVQAYEKPVISLVWIGFILLTFGFGLAIYRRILDVRISTKRGSL